MCTAMPSLLTNFEVVFMWLDQLDAVSLVLSFLPFIPSRTGHMPDRGYPVYRML